MHVILRMTLCGAALAALAACSSDDNIGKTALVCPTVGVLSDASVLHVYGDGAARDQANTAYVLEFMRSYLMECALEKNRLTASLRFEARAKTGPAVPSSEYEYPYFVAVLSPDGEVISRDLRKASVKFKSGATEALFAEKYDDIEFTVPEGMDGLGYEILVGFQLTREQIDALREKKAAPAASPDLIMQK